MKEKQNIEINKKIVIVLIAIIFIVLVSLLLFKNFLESNQTPELIYDNLTTIKQVIEYHGSKYISEEESNDNNYSLDVYLEFKVKPYEDDNTSNEEYYNELLEDSAKVLYYKNFRMIDEKNDITVEVICKNGKIDSIIINGIEDYFIYMDSQISMREYKEISKTEITVQSEVLQNCINNSWNTGVYFGERDSIFDEYYIYFDEGLEVRTIDNMIYNVIFTNKYQGNVVNNTYPGMQLENVEDLMGEPTFKDEDLGILGYKGENIYVFFTETEISIYRVTTADTDDFFDLADRYLNEELDFLEFMNELTYLWLDYSEYTYDSESVFIAYPLKGVEIKLNYGDDLNGIYIYNNIKTNLSRVENYFDNTDFVARLQIDSVFEAEKRRVSKNQNLLKLCNEYKETLDQEKKDSIGENSNYDIYPELDNNGLIYEMKFISKFDNTPNRELSDTINSYLWLDNNNFLYSKKGKGMYVYNLETGTVRRILTGTEDYELKGFENGILKYDDTEIEFQY